MEVGEGGNKPGKVTAALRGKSVDSWRRDRDCGVLVFPVTPFAAGCEREVRFA